MMIKGSSVSRDTHLQPPTTLELPPDTVLKMWSRINDSRSITAEIAEKRSVGANYFYRMAISSIVLARARSSGLAVLVLQHSPLVDDDDLVRLVPLSKRLNAVSG